MDNVQKIIEKQQADHTDSPVEKIYTTEQTEDLGQIEDAIDPSTRAEMQRAASEATRQSAATATQTKAQGSNETPRKIGKANGRVEFDQVEGNDEPLPFEEPAQVVQHADDEGVDQATEEPGDVAEENGEQNGERRGLGYYVGGSFHIAAKAIRPKTVSLLTLPLRVTSDVLEGAAELVESNNPARTAVHMMSDVITYPLRIGRELFKQPMQAASAE